MKRGIKTVRKELKQAIREFNTHAKKVRKLQTELVTCPMYSPYADINRRLVGKNVTDDSVYNIGWYDGYTVCRGEMLNGQTSRIIK